MICLFKHLLTFPFFDFSFPEFEYDGGHKINHQEKHLQVPQLARQRNQNPQGNSLR